MIRDGIRYIFFLLLLVVIPLQLFAQSAEVFRGNDGVSSVFGEFRSDHFHAGIDYRTPEGVGMELYAPDSGYVEKIEILPWVYGKVLYFRTKAGNYAVYVHLSRFYPELERFVRLKQVENRTYPIDLAFAEDQFILEPGQLIAYSGDTGTRAPHLHFEWREGFDKLVNPQVAGFSIDDRKKPEIYSLVLLPMDDETIINGKLAPAEFAPELTPDSTYIIKDSIFAWGEIGLAISAVDMQSEENPNTFGLWAYELYLNDSLVFSARYDSFYLSQSSYLGTVWDLEVKEWFGKRCHNLYIPPYADLPFWDGLEAGAGILDITTLPRDSNTIQVYCRDFSGNSTHLTFTTIRSIPSELSLNCEERDSKLECYLELYDTKLASTLRWWRSSTAKTWKSLSPSVRGENEFTVAFPDSPSVKLVRLTNLEKTYPFPVYWCAVSPEQYFESFPEPTLSWKLLRNMFYIDISFSNFIQTNPFGWIRYLDASDHILCEHSALLVANSATRFSTRIAPIAKSSKISLTVSWTNPSGISQQAESMVTYYLLHPDKGTTIISDDGELVLEVPTGAVFDETYITLTRLDALYDSLSRSGTWSIAPEPLLFKSPVKLWVKVDTFLVTDSTDRYCLAEYVAGKWSFVGSEIDSALGYVGGEINPLGTFSLRSDTDPPIIIPGLKDGAVLSGSPASIYAEVIDGLAGFSLTNLPEIYLDGEWMVGEYHPVKESLTYFPLEGLKLGAHVLVFQATDNLGNAVVDTVRFRIGK